MPPDGRRDSIARRRPPRHRKASTPTSPRRIITPLGVHGTSASPTLDDATCVDRGQAVDVLVGRDQLGHRGVVETVGQRKLKQDAVDVVAAVEFVDQAGQVVGAGVGGKALVLAVDADLGAGLVLVVDVDVRGRIVADEDRDQARRPAVCRWRIRRPRTATFDAASRRSPCRQSVGSSRRCPCQSGSSCVALAFEVVLEFSKCVLEARKYAGRRQDVDRDAEKHARDTDPDRPQAELLLASLHRRGAHHDRDRPEKRVGDQRTTRCRSRSRFARGESPPTPRPSAESPPSAPAA